VLNFYVTYVIIAIKYEESIKAIIKNPIQINLKGEKQDGKINN